MSNYIRKSHNVTVLLYHLVFPAKYRRVVFDEEVDIVLKEHHDGTLSWLDTSCNGLEFMALFPFKINYSNGFIEPCSTVLNYKAFGNVSWSEM